MTVGTGIGGGIILNGQLYRGVDGSHPEIGHHVIDYSGPLCSCGAKVCWEALACGPAIAERFSRENTFEHPRRNKLTAKQVCEPATAPAIPRRRSRSRKRVIILASESPT